MGSASSPVSPIAAPPTCCCATQTPRDSKHEQRTTKKRAKDHRDKVTIRHGIKRAAQQRWWQWWWWRWWTCLGLSKFFWERGPRTSAGAARVYEAAGPRLHEAKKLHK